MIEIKYTGDALWARIERARAEVDQRLRKTVDALTQAEIPHAIVGGHAANYWISRVDESAVRATPDVEVLVFHQDFSDAIHALKSAGFEQHASASKVVFRDAGSISNLAVVKLAAHDASLGELVPMDVGQTLPLDAFVCHCLTRRRHLDCLYLRDMISVALIDDAWLPRLPTELAARLKELLDDPDG